MSDIIKTKKGYTNIETGQLYDVFGFEINDE